MTSETRRLVGRLRVALPAADAFALFTPLGEREWAHGWDPQFPCPIDDDTVPGTVFETDAHGRRTTWVVTSNEPPHGIAYARVTPGDRAGTVSVALKPANDHTEVEVTYVLTSLASSAERDLQRFADGYVAYLQSWEHDIAACLARRA